MSITRPAARTRIARLFRISGALAVTAVAALAACADVPVAPVATAPSQVETTAGSTVKALTWSKPAAVATWSLDIGPEGGSISVPNGIKVTFPSGALAAPTRITVTRLAGSIVAYDFQPHGLTFAAPVQIELATAGTNLKGIDLLGTEGGYFADQASLNQTLGTAVVTEFQATTVSADKAWIRFNINHFSGYLLGVDRL